MRRSRFIALVSMGTATLALTACDDPVQTSVFETVDQCITSGTYSREECNANFETARKVHTETAPTFASKADCEAEFGPGQCGAPQQPQQQTAMGGGSMFMPLMLGYMMGSMSSGGRSVATQPLYRTPQGGQAGAFRTATGDVVAKGVGRTTVNANSSVAKAPTPSSTVARGGFGARASTSAGG